MLGQPVVQPARGDIAFMRQPVDAACTGVAGFSSDTVQKCARNAATARGLRGEEILQVAAVGNRRCAAMIEIMREADEFAAGFRYERVNRLARIEEARPCLGGDLRGQCGFAAASVEGVIAVP